MKIPALGLAVKLAGMMALATGLVAGVITWHAMAVMHEQLDQNFELEGEALALALAAAVERDVDSLTLAHGAVDSIKGVRGVRYVYLENEEGEPELHTFSPYFPPRLKGQNKIPPEGLHGPRNVQVAYLELDLDPLDAGGPKTRIIDVAAPISGGILGGVHVGIDQGIVQSQVSAAQLGLFWLGSAAAVVGVGLGLLLVLVVVIRPIRELTRATADIVSKGDLSQEIRIRSADEIGQLSETFARMMEKLREIPNGLKESTAILATAVANLTASTGEHGQTLTRQAVALQETQVTAQEIQQTSLLASQKAEAVLQVAERADEVSRSGETAIQQSLDAIADLRRRVGEISEKISQLSERTMQIGGITETVKDLADQSNMLALNASIEAVRSGEHGKGFAVVAREIRNLADQSIKATERVREILDDISSAILSAVESTETGTARMESGLVQVRTSGENLKELSSIVRDNAAAVRQIAAAVSQQNAGISQIFTAVQDLAKMMEENISRLSSTSQAATNVREVAARVQQVVQSFKV